MTRILVAAGVLIAALVVQDKDVTVVPTEAALASGEQHSYRLSLQAGEAATVVVEQRGIDVSVRTLDPEGRLLAVVQNNYRRDGEERPIIVANTTGNYSLVVQSAFHGQGEGAYAIRLAEIRPATAGDRSLQEAATLHADGMALIETGKLEDAAARLRHALEILETVKGPDDVATARVVSSLADCAFNQKRFAEAAALFLRALPILERALGEDDPVTLHTLQGLGIHVLVYRPACRG